MTEIETYKIRMDKEENPALDEIMRNADSGRSEKDYIHAIEAIEKRYEDQLSSTIKGLKAEKKAIRRRTKKLKKDLTEKLSYKHIEPKLKRQIQQEFADLENKELEGLATYLEGRFGDAHKRIYGEIRSKSTINDVSDDVAAKLCLEHMMNDSTQGEERRRIMLEHFKGYQKTDGDYRTDVKKLNGIIFEIFTIPPVGLISVFTAGLLPAITYGIAISWKKNGRRKQRNALRKCTAYKLMQIERDQDG